MQIPTHIFGFKASPIGTPAPSLLGETTFDGVKIAVLRWERAHFTVETLKPSDGWFKSYEVATSTRTCSLLQYRNPLFSSRPIPNLRSKEVSNSKSTNGVLPRWLSDERVWPIIGNKYARFVGQFHYGVTVAYLFTFDEELDSEFVVHQVDVSQESAEQHYKNEK